MSCLEYCKMCYTMSTRRSNGDCEGCVECGAVEQGFLYLEEWDDAEGLLVDEDGMLVCEDSMEIVGSELRGGY